jgi:DNA-binding transcriptional ArsR family regulator
MNESSNLLCVDAPGAEAIRGGLLEGDAARLAAERALPDSTRLMLAAALREGEEQCVCDLARGS